jgi:hypothetical protein
MIPEPEADGFRRYGANAYNKGARENKEKCAMSVAQRGMRFGSMFPVQCTRKRGQGPDGLLCTQHAKPRT